MKSSQSMAPSMTDALVVVNVGLFVVPNNNGANSASLPVI